MKIGLLCAMKTEFDQLLPYLRETARHEVAKTTVIEGDVNGRLQGKRGHHGAAADRPLCGDAYHHGRRGREHGSAAGHSRAGIFPAPGAA